MTHALCLHKHKSMHVIYKITPGRYNKNKSYRFVDESFLIKYMAQSYYMWICNSLLHMHPPLPGFVYAFIIVLSSRCLDFINSGFELKLK